VKPTVSDEQNHLIFATLRLSFNEQIVGARATKNLTGTEGLRLGNVRNEPGVSKSFIGLGDGRPELDCTHYIYTERGREGGENAGDEVLIINPDLCLSIKC